MFVDFKLDTAYEGPIYKQIAERISEAIKDGKLSAGFKLPTVRELSGEIGVACGTIKHAYEYLEEQGFVEMVQGSGSFVIDQNEDFASRKEKAMVAINQLFSRLESLGFTPREMEIYLNLKLRGLEEKYDVVKVALVDCNPETLQMIERQLSQIGYAETAAFDLARIDEAAEHLLQVQILYCNQSDKAFDRHLFSEEVELARKKFYKASLESGVKEDLIWGYSGSESLVSFFNDTPNNTLGLFWHDSPNYFSIFPRENVRGEKNKRPTPRSMKIQKTERNNQNYIAHKRSALNG